MEKLPKCFSCDQICEAQLNEDHECWGRATVSERNALTRFLMSLAQPQQPYGKPQELPTARTPEVMKHHIKRSGR